MQGPLARARRLPVLAHTVVLALVASSLAFLATVAVAPAAHAAGTPDLQLSDGPAATVLYGRDVPVELTASLGSGQPKGYNLAYRFVLPAGTSYVGGSAGTEAGEPTVITDAPTTGRTTLIWPNTYDLVAGASHTLAFQVRYQDTGSASTPRYDVGDPLPIDMGAYLSTDPRDEADFSALGVPQTGVDSYTGSAEKSTTTQLTAIEIEKSEPHPEGEIPRGVHDHQTVYTLTLTNNDVNPTTGVTVDDYLPAGLEFLGCAGTTDHSAAEEYAGSGPIVVAQPTSDCVDPVLVETVDTDPDGSGPLESGVYTHVRWTHPGTFAAGEVKRIRYAAAIPIRENTLTWPGATPGTTGAQTANLDNNSGPETYDEQPLLNGAIAAGTYQSPVSGPQAVSDEGTLLRTAEDIAIQKSNNLASLDQGDLTRWTIDLQVSEYRRVDHVVVDDVVPDGLCPLGPQSYEDPSDRQTECDPVSGHGPSAAYTSVAEQADGTYAIRWDETTVPSLASIARSGTRQLTFWTRTRTDYQQDFHAAGPVLSRDSVTNHISTHGQDWVVEGSDGALVDHDEVDGQDDYDVSGSGKAATGPVISKTVAAHYPASGDCNDLAAADYGRTVPTYGPGDFVCWKLVLAFPPYLDTHSQDVYDVLPDGVDFVPGTSQTVPGENTVDVGPVDTSVDGWLHWEIGNGGTDVVDAGSKVFAVTVKTRVGPPAGHHSGDVDGNLMKFSYENTAGASYTLRDKVDFKLGLPELAVTKTADDSTVDAGQVVHYTVGVRNTGTAPADDARIWDQLPTGVTCARISAISDGGSCASGRITWTGVDVAAASTTSLTYALTVPSGDVRPNVTYTNHVGVVEWTYTTDDGTPYQMVPANTTVKDPGLPSPNMPAAEATATIRTADTSVVKGRTTSVAETGNNAANQATIGEVITYSVITTIPKNTTVYDARVTDPLGSRQTLVPGSLCVNGCTLDGAAFGAVAESPANTVVATMPTTYAPPSGSDGVLVLTFQARVLDVAANHRGQTLANTATLGYTDQGGTGRTKAGSVSTTIVEPQVDVTKSYAGPRTVAPGEVKTYTLRATSTGVTAHDLVIVDTLPAGTDPATINGGGTWDATARTITWTQTTTPALASVQPGTPVDLTYTVQVENPAVGGTVYTNDVLLTSASLSTTPGARTPASAASTAGDYEDADTASIAVALPTVTKVVDLADATIGSDLTWTVTVEVPKDTRYFDATVVDAVPDGLAADGYGTMTCTSGCLGDDPSIGTFPITTSGATQQAAWFLGDLAPAPTKRVYTLTLSGHVLDTKRAGGALATPVSLINQARVQTNRTDTMPATPTTVPASYADTVGPASATTAVHAPRLTIDKAANQGPTVKPGQALTYTITVTNTGDWPAYDVLVTDQPDSELTEISPVSGSPYVTDGWSAGDPDLAWTIPGPVAAGATVTLTYTASVAAAGIAPPGATVHNTATVDTYYGLPDRDPDERTHHGPSDAVDLTVVTYADVEITKVADHDEYLGGDLVTWTLTVTNHGLSAAADVVVTDPLPTKTDFVSVTPGAPTCGVTSGTLTCELGSLASGETRTITVTAKAQGLPPANTTETPHHHDLTISKVEQAVSLAAGETTTVDLSCADNGFMSDGSAEIMHVDQGTGSPSDVLVRRASTLSASGYRFTLTNGTTGQAQAKLFGTCLPDDTEVGEGHAHGLDVSGAKTQATGAMTAGRHTFTLPVSAHHRAIAPGIEVLTGTARLVASEPVPGGWQLTVEALEPSTATLSLRELADKTLGAAPAGHQHRLSFSHIVRTVSVPDGESVQRVTCLDGSKGIVGTYDLPAGVVLLGHEPQPINRDFRLWNTTGHAVDVVLDLECLAIRTGPALDETFTLTNTATAASPTYDPDLSNNSATATSELTVSAGTTPTAPSAPLVPATPSTPLAPGSTGGAPVVAAKTLAATLDVGARGKRATVEVRCAATADSCAGTLRLTAKVVTPGHRATRVVIATATYQAAPGERSLVRFTVKKKYRAAVRHDRARAFRIR